MALPSHASHRDIRIGTLVGGNQPDPAGYVKKIMPHGFESIELTFWQEIPEGCDLKRLAADIRAALAPTGAVVGAIGIYGNPLENGDKDVRTRQGWERLIDAAGDFGTDTVCGFTGRLRGKSIPDSIPRFAEVFKPLAERAGQRGVRLGFENCAMGGDWNGGDWNIAHSPEAWELMFGALPLPNLGLEWEPCHQWVRLVEPLPQLRRWAGRVFHIHGKDATVHRDILRETGLGGPKAWCHHRHPGFGDTDWRYVIDILRQAGWQGSIDIEGWHDPVYRDDLEMTGQVRAMEFLKECRGGPFAASP